MTSNLGIPTEDYANQRVRSSKKLTGSVSENNFAHNGSRIEKFNEAKYEKPKKANPNRRVNSASKNIKGITNIQKASMQDYSQYTKNLYKSIDQMNLQRA